MTSEAHSREPSRRDFLTRAWQALGALVFGAFGFIGVRFLSSRSVPSDFGTVVTAGHMDDFAPGTVTPFETAHFYLVRTEDGAFLALHWKCTHLDCTILWNELDDQFQCPCHGSMFTHVGDVLNPPAPRPLACLPVIIAEDGQIQVDTGTLIQRTEVSSADFVQQLPPP